MALHGLRNQIVDLVVTLDTLPTLPSVVSLLDGKLNSPDVSVSEVASIIEDDPVLTARVLKLLASPVYSTIYKRAAANASLAELGNKGSLQMAIVRLGITGIRDLVLSTAVLHALDLNADFSFDRNEFWRHSICTGIISNTLLDYARNDSLQVSATEAILAGLCHDIGKIILDQYFPEQFKDILSTAEREGKMTYEVESDCLGIEHGEIGGLLAKRWGLPPSIEVAMSFHHRRGEVNESEAKYSDLLNIVVLADFIANHQNLGFSGNFCSPDFPRESFTALGLETGDIPSILATVQIEAAKSELLTSIRS